MSIAFQQALIIIGVMIIYGLVLGFVAGLIWKDNRPYGVKGDYLIAIASSIVFGLLEWFLLPVLGFSQTLKLLGTFIEAPCIALVILWLIRYLKKNK
jgi:uncharacterized membrane protein YeaQ/YmgE (transglycosylase-associated protein family)